MHVPSPGTRTCIEQARSVRAAFHTLKSGGRWGRQLAPSNRSLGRRIARAGRAASLQAQQHQALTVEPQHERDHDVTAERIADRVALHERSQAVEALRMSVWPATNHTPVSAAADHARIACSTLRSCASGYGHYRAGDPYLDRLTPRLAAGAG